MGANDYYKHGTHNAICAVCGFKHKADQLKKRWDGVYVCAADWEPRHPMDLYNPTIRDNTGPNIGQAEPTDTFI